MPLTRDFHEGVRARVERDPEFQAALVEEIVAAVRGGEYGLAVRLLGDLMPRTAFERILSSVDSARAAVRAERSLPQGGKGGQSQ